MNKLRRNKLNGLSGELLSIKHKIEMIMNEEQDVFDNMPENLQGSIRGSESEESIDVMQEVVDSIDDIVDLLQEI